tara:strand:+ start:368 stop:490 length:123 start_codon:yes stop_codon:yes gene_type:complete
MSNLTVAQQRKLIRELRKASNLHKKQADLIERSLRKRTTK